MLFDHEHVWGCGGSKLLMLGYDWWCMHVGCWCAMAWG